MAEYISLLNKPPKKSPILLRMMVLVLAMICGGFISSICVKQIIIHMDTNNQFNSKVIDRHGVGPNIKDWDVPYVVHYPQPKTFGRAECANNPVRLFVILSMQRSGSGWFETLLNSHMNVSSNGEIFSVLNRRKNISSILDTLDQIYNLDWFSSASRNECSAAVGFKWMLNQGLMQHHKEIAEYFNHQGVSLIFLLRRNLLRRMVSVLANSHDRYAKLLNGTHKSHVHRPEEADALSKYKPAINVKTLINDLKEVEETAQKALEYFSSARHIVLYYEDIIKDRTKLKDVQNFLWLPQMQLTSRQIKIHQGLLSDQVKNWEEVKNCLTGTSYERFLHPDY